MAYFVQISLIDASFYEGDIDPVHHIYAVDLENGRIVVRSRRFLEKEDRFAEFFLSKEDQDSFKELVKGGFGTIVSLVKGKHVGREGLPYRHAEVQFLDLEPFLLPDYLFNPDGRNLERRYVDYPDTDAKQLYAYFRSIALFLAEKSGRPLPVVPIPQKQLP